MAEQSSFTACSAGGAVGCCGTGRLHGERRCIAASRRARNMADSRRTAAGWHLDGFFNAGVNE
jgi:hypothetical protein